MLFKPMKLKEAREFYEKLGKSKTDWLCRTGRDDIYFFTNGIIKRIKPLLCPNDRTVICI